MSKEEIISSGLLEYYVLGDTTAEETKWVEDLCVLYPELKEEINNIEFALYNYAKSAALQPSNKVKAEIFKQLQLSEKNAVEEKTKDKLKIINMVRITKIFAAACTIIFFLGGFIIYSFYKKISQSKEEIALLSQQLVQQKEEMSIVHSKYSLPLKMVPEVAPKDADAKIYWLTNTGDIYIDASNLPATPAGMQYQLWAIVDGKAIDAGLVDNSKNAFHLQKMKTFGKAQAFALTLEKQGGVIASSEKPYVIVKL